MIKMTFSGATNKGLVRQNNEDTYICQHIWDNQHVLCVVIDGLGGYEGGEIAADIAKNTIVSYLQRNRLGNLQDLLKQAVTQANNDIVTYQTQTPNCNRMGCVLTAGLFDLQEGLLNVAHVGDSRLYWWQDGNLRKLTHDHSLVGYREEVGQLTEEEAMNHPQRNIVERILGDKMHHLDDKGFIESTIYPLHDGTHFIFCSDGLTDMVTSAEISLIVQNNLDDLDACVDALIRAACDHGGRDNVTVVMSYYSNDEAISIIQQDQSIYGNRAAVKPPEFHTPESSVRQSDVDEQPRQAESVAQTIALAAEREDIYEDQAALSDGVDDKPRRRFPWLPVCLASLAIAACLASLYGGYRLGCRQRFIDMEDQVAIRDSSIIALQDSIRHLEQQNYDMSVILDKFSVGY